MNNPRPLMYCPSCQRVHSLPKEPRCAQARCDLCRSIAYCYVTPPSVETLWGPVPRPLDPYTLRAARLFGVHRDHVTLQQRAVAKEMVYFTTYSFSVPSHIAVRFATPVVVAAWRKLFPDAVLQLPVSSKRPRPL